MNKLSVAKRAKILHLLVEGTSLRVISRVTGASINTISKLLVDAGEACAAYHDETVRQVRAKRVHVDEIWTFTYAKQKNVKTAKAAPEGAGDTWTWTAIDADSKLIVSWLVGPRDAGSAYTFVNDLADRLATRVQLTSDGLRTLVKIKVPSSSSSLVYCSRAAKRGPGSHRGREIRRRLADAGRAESPGVGGDRVEGHRLWG